MRHAKNGSFLGSVDRRRGGVYLIGVQLASSSLSTGQAPFSPFSKVFSTCGHSVDLEFKKLSFPSSSHCVYVYVVRTVL